ncbi:PAS domain S-box protein [Methylosinus sporium]|uniref:histidine kinase n=1 Tax=Methylosinus sporium TaxID=428 RepID=A0A549SCV8_METSR|nr:MULTISPECIES: PAS domain-containing sensor histidine kinase [Methylosinus]MBU3887189.1 PAS domain S-box protein [Methylosinus sp. KRF6]TRL23873.1 PAS domain S-box protein [Methylosinus sporium]
MSFDSIGDDHFRLAVESAPAAMIVSSADGLIQFVNAETERMFGYRSDELVGKSIDILVPAHMRATHASLRRSFFAHPSKRPMGVGRDLKATRRDGSEFPVEIGLTPIESESGPIVLATVLDITARREAENALSQRAAELERANERLAQFAYVASHDLQEPLRKIAAFSDILEHAISSANATDMSYANSVMRSSALRARELVDDLLTYSRAINDAQNVQELDLREEIELAVNDLSETIAETNARLRIEAPHVPIRADRSQFARLTHNIVSNALKYRKPDCAPDVVIRATQSEREIVVSFADNGIGFESKYEHLVFEPFKRLHPKGKYPGTGIGLAICKSIADRHGWRLSVTSQPGLGSIFYVAIPLGRASNE